MKYKLFVVFCSRRRHLGLRLMRFYATVQTKCFQGFANISLLLNDLWPEEGPVQTKANFFSLLNQKKIDKTFRASWLYLLTPLERPYHSPELIIK